MRKGLAKAIVGPNVFTLASIETARRVLLRVSAASKY